MMLLAGALAFLQAAAEDPPAVAAKVDAFLRSASGYNAKAEPPAVGDDVFLKRIHRDLVHAEPSDAELKVFVADPDPQKRAKEVDRLLADERFGKAWAARFAQVLLGKPGITDIAGMTEVLEMKGIVQFQDWLGQRFNKDLPWSETVHQIIDSRGTTAGDPALAYKLSFYRGGNMPVEFALGVARHFLGIRLNCARCHDHPFDVWDTGGLYGLAAFAARQKVRIVDGLVELKYADDGDLKGPGGAVSPKSLFGFKPGKHDDWMKGLADDLSGRSARQLQNALVNRVWAGLFGYGLVHPVDDFDRMRAPFSQAALDALARDTHANRNSLKRLVRILCATSAYQLPTPEEMPGATSFRHVMKQRAAPGMGLHKPLTKPTPLPLAFDTPAGWLRVWDRYKGKGLFLVRGKSDPTLTAEVWLADKDRSKQILETNVAQFAGAKKRSEVLQGALKVTLGELAGLNSCIRGSDGPVDWIVIAAVVEAPAGPHTVRFEGPASVVNEWREEFRALLQGLK